MNRLAVLAIFFSAGFAISAEAPIELRAADGTLKRPLQVNSEGATKFAVLIFYLHDCPICNAYAPEIERLCAEFQPKGCAFYIVQTDPSVSADVAQKHAKDYGLNCPILVDNSNQLARKCGATITPQVAIVGANERILYLGRIDDLYADYGKRRTEATVRDLRTALNAALSGKPVPPAGGPAIGCFIPIQK